jgi:hypothetical protein
MGAAATTGVVSGFADANEIESGEIVKSSCGLLPPPRPCANAGVTPAAHKTTMQKTRRAIAMTVIRAP